MAACYAIGTCIFYSIVMIILFISKRKIINEQTRLYTNMLFSNLLGLILELATMIYIYEVKNYNILFANVLVKTYMLYTAFFVTQMTLYICSIAYEKSNHEYYEKIKITLRVFLTMVMMTAVFLPIHIHELYRFGTQLLYILSYSSINIIIWITVLLKNMKKFNLRTTAPILVIVVVGLSAGLYQVFNPSIAILTIVEFELMILSYLTMENTDYKMITNLTIAKNKVTEAYNNKNEFLKNMSHEIRTPLNGLIGLSEDIKSYEDELPKELLAETDEIIYNSNLLLETVSSIIDINKLNSHQFDKVEHNYKISEVMEQVKKSFFNRVKTNVNFNVRIAEDFPILYGDKDHIRQILTKIIDNSVLSTISGTIDVTIDLAEDRPVPTLRVLINDTGKGIHEEVLPYIYNYNDEKIKKNKYYDAKTFLNFTVAKKLLDALKGNISLSSTYHQGTTVMLEIPQQEKKEEK